MCVLIRDQKKRIRHRATWSRSPGTGRGRDWSDETRRPGTPRVVRGYQKLGKKHGIDSPSELPEGTICVHSLILDFCATDCERILSNCFKTSSWL